MKQGSNRWRSPDRGPSRPRDPRPCLPEPPPDLISLFAPAANVTRQIHRHTDIFPTLRSAIGTPQDAAEPKSSPRPPKQRACLGFRATRQPGSRSRGGVRHDSGGEKTSAEGDVGVPISRLRRPFAVCGIPLQRDLPTPLPLLALARAF